jgi:hypothetical protein
MDTKAGDLEDLAKASSKSVDSDKEAGTVPKASGSAPDEDAPDPDEDDLDDLDGRFCTRLLKLTLTSSSRHAR